MADGDRTPWKEHTGLSEERTYARLYPTEHQKSCWEAEDEEEGFSSLSKYLIAKIERARQTPGRHHRDHTDSTSDTRVTELQEEIDRLEEELERTRQKTAGRRDIHDTDVLKQFLSQHPQSLDQLFGRIVESGVLDEFVRKRVEDQLYYLAQRDIVEYDRHNQGWKLADGGET